MPRRRLLIPLLAALVAAIAPLVSAAPAGADQPWGVASELPGIAALNVGGTASVFAISCSSAGNCGLIGTYTDASNAVQAFVANEVDSVWSSAQAIAGVASLNTGGLIKVEAISCTTATDCSATGTYTTSQGGLGAFVVDESGGTWGTAQPLPLSSSLPAGGIDATLEIDCTSPGNCVTGGTYGGGGTAHAIVATETSGTWSGAVVVPGTDQLSAGGLAEAIEVACPQAGSCTMAGIYGTSLTNVQGWVDQESSGTWGTAQAIPGLSALNVGTLAGPNTLACSSVGNCALGGFYSASKTSVEPFVATEVSGTWQSAFEAGDASDLNPGGVGIVDSIACPADGRCEAVGLTTDELGNVQEFVMSQSDGSWGPMEIMPGTDVLNAYGTAEAPAVSCVGPGDCRSVGGYTDGLNIVQAYDVADVGGAWQNAEETPGTVKLNVGGFAELEYVSCTSDGGCGAAGVYKDHNFSTQVMVMSAAPTTATVTPPGAPGEKLASRTVGVVTITITAPSSTGGAPITKYQYSVNGGAWKSTTSTRVTLRHLRAKSKVSVRVRAVNSAGPGPTSGAKSVTVR